MNNVPLVSIIMPTYKRSDMLSRAIKSVLTQTYSNIEIIVVDDNNPDTEWRKKTQGIMSEYNNNSKIKYILHPYNKNGSAARNTGIQQATGDIVTFLDDDDIYCPDKIRKQVDYLLNNPQFRAVYCGWIRGGKKVLPKGEGDLSFGMLSGTNIIITNSIMMWRRDAIACGGWDENLKRHQEAAFILNFFRHGGKIGRVIDYLVEFDTSDRGNEINSYANETSLKYLLSSYDDLVNRIEEKTKGARKLIYAHRYSSMILSHLKQKEFIPAIRIYFSSPFIINKILISYLLRRCGNRWL